MATKNTAKETAKNNAKTVTNLTRAELVIVIAKGAAHELEGKRGRALNLMKTGMTVGEYRMALDRHKLHGYCGWALRTANKLGYAKIEAPKTHAKKAA